MNNEIEDIKHTLERHEQASIEDAKDLKDLRTRVENLEKAARASSRIAEIFYKEIHDMVLHSSSPGNLDRFRQAFVAANKELSEALYPGF